MSLTAKFISGGRWRIFEEPKKGLHYVVAVDTASGKNKRQTNDSVANVLCIETGNQCAIITGQHSPDIMKIESEKAGYWYNEAEIAVELEMHGKTIIDGLKDSYPNLFYHDESLTSMVSGMSKEFGWNALRFRQTAIDWLQEAIGAATSEKPEERKMGIFVKDLQTVQQLSYFIRNSKNGKWEAAPGKKDDCVSALYISNFVRRKRYTTFVHPEAEKPRESTYEDLLHRSTDEDDEERNMDFNADDF